MVLSDYDYLRDRDTAIAFEHRAAAKGKEIGAVRWVLAIPQVWFFEPPSTVSIRAASNHPFRGAADPNAGLGPGVLAERGPAAVGAFVISARRPAETRSKSFHVYSASTGT
ncbi:hypothetical protein [Nonomuraea sp. bgisy101]|uniref:hypothetical protein n=1 Tax=Nonomuraea sp. bgisy101 TaxID=3413784 RepID=UPI003D72730E